MRDVFAKNMDKLLIDRPGRFRWWEGVLQVPKTTLHRWVTMGLAKRDKRSEAYLEQIVRYFGLPDYECLWHEDAKSKADQSRIRLATKKQESRIVCPKESPQQATRRIQEAGLWDAFMWRVDAADETDAELQLVHMIMNGNWTSVLIIEHMQARGMAEIDLESQVDQTRTSLQEAGLWDTFKRKKKVDDESADEALRAMLRGFWMPQGLIERCEVWHTKEQIQEAGLWNEWKRLMGLAVDDDEEAEVVLGTVINNDYDAIEIIERTKAELDAESSTSESTDG